jgi:predicted transcriptional regulator
MDKYNMDDGIYLVLKLKNIKILIRYLRSNYVISSEAYRRRWNLPADYPMTVPNYSNRG